MIDSSYLTLYDYERIRKNAYFQSKEELLNESRIKTEQEYDKNARARSLRDKIINYDKNNPKIELSDVDLANIEKRKMLLKLAQKEIDNNEDVVKEMEKLSLYAKVAHIREKQKKEHKELEKFFKRKEDKLDTMMELERLKGLKQYQDREKERKKANKEGSLVVIDQIKEKQKEKLKELELLKKEQKEMLEFAKKLAEDEIKEAELRRIHNEKMAKEIEESNKISSMNKQKKIIEEREYDLKLLKYNMEKAKKEEEDLKEKKRIAAEKEKELQKLRERQEKAQDKYIELDALRAKRAFEDSERQFRRKQKEEEILRQKRMNDLLLANAKQKKNKELQLVEQAKQEKDEYERIVKKQLYDMEVEKKIEAEKKRKRYEHNNDLLKMIKLREEKNKVYDREILEEGRKNRQSKKFKI